MFYDDVSGVALDPKLAKEARRVEMKLFYKRGVYMYDTIDNSYRLSRENSKLLSGGLMATRAMTRILITDLG